MRDDLSRSSRDVFLNLGPLSDAEQQRNRPWVDFLRDEGWGMTGRLRLKAKVERRKANCERA